ncbi:hypothetical protein SEA_NICEHOUSE_207 [Rhodococcus phage NiceHouse]|nr:hypothetical protein SEA_NICEHOUSE_207 [Rhodococcus phage NiceHouse]
MTVAYFLSIIVVCLVLIAVGIAYAMSESKKSPVGVIVVALGVSVIIASSVFMTFQAERNGKLNCQNNLNGRVVNGQCITGSDWRVITDY